ncbi:MAG: tRNA threonylcarbamoyladenosine dehydratase [Paludibacteraceae bacterium]|nr:tRNA threonylcarbamoyladenosine dehydratase [Paludibacteraceae bacterium]
MFNFTERTQLLIGEEGVSRLSNARVLVVGTGGVGAYAAEMICRAGVGHITLVDSDTVKPSNINRQLPALHSTIGKYKVDLLAERFKDINPDAEIVAIKEFLDDSNLERIMSEGFDYVIDAIDSITPKIHLIEYCLKNKVKIISSMGAGGRLDPSKVQIADISKTYQCSLARTVRERLKKDGISKGLKVVFSSEPVKKDSVIEVNDEKCKRSTTGTVSYIPAVFGCYLASEVITYFLQNKK